MLEFFGPYWNRSDGLGRMAVPRYLDRTYQQTVSPVNATSVNLFVFS